MIWIKHIIHIVFRGSKENIQVTPVNVLTSKIFIAFYSTPLSIIRIIEHVNLYSFTHINQHNMSLRKQGKLTSDTGTNIWQDHIPILWKRETCVMWFWSWKAYSRVNGPNQLIMTKIFKNTFYFDLTISKTDSNDLDRSIWFKNLFQHLFISILRFLVRVIHD